MTGGNASTFVALLNLAGKSGEAAFERRRGHWALWRTLEDSDFFSIQGGIPC
jgi:hypothetical protein